MICDLVDVRRNERLSPTFRRLHLGGAALADLGVAGPWLDQRFKLIVPDPGGEAPRLPQGFDGYQEWLALPASERGHMRTYSVRDVIGTGAETELVVDVVLHPGAHGPGSTWAESARPGDRVGLLAPRRGVDFGGIEFAPGDRAELLIVGDESAVPAVARILADLPPHAHGAAFLEVPESADVLALTRPTGLSVRWLPRAGTPRGEALYAAVLAHLAGPDATTEPDEGSGAGRGERAGGSAGAPPGDETVDPDLWETPTYSSSGEAVEDATRDAERYAWIAGEAAFVTGLRRILVREQGWPRRQVCFMGYWREGRAGG